MKLLLSVAYLAMAATVALWPAACASAESAITASHAGANQADPLQARLDFAEQYYRYPGRIKDTLVPPRWLRTGEQFVYWAATGPHQGSWVLVDARSGAGEPLIAPADLQAQLAQLTGKPVAPPDNLFIVIAPDQQRIVFNYQERAYTLGLYGHRISLAGGPLQRLTADPGLHRIYPSPSGRYYVDGHSTRTQPRAWDVSAVDGRTVFRYAKADASALVQIHYSPPEAITTLATDGVTPLYGVLYKPWDFDPHKRYPVIDCIYGGPFTTAVPWSFVGTSEETRIAGALAQMGFIVMVLDARGTPGRGKAFQDANYGRIGQIEISDHIAALRQAATTRPSMDMDRAGIYGHSWGGYFALRGMLTAPDFFKAGYAGAPGELEEESIINEPYLGLRDKNPEAYRAGSNLLAAAHLHGALRIMHGTSDTDAPLSTTMRMVDALIRADKPVELLIMPGQPHSPTEPARRYYYNDVRRFFLRTLGDTPPDKPVSAKKSSTKNQNPAEPNGGAAH